VYESDWQISSFNDMMKNGSIPAQSTMRATVNAHCISVTKTAAFSIPILILFMTRKAAITLLPFREMKVGM
jgi:hypothetical protein